MTEIPTRTISVHEATRRRVICDLWNLFERDAAALEDLEARLRTAHARLDTIRQIVAERAWLKKTHTSVRVSEYRPRGYCAYDNAKMPCDAIGLLLEIEQALGDVP